MKAPKHRLTIWQSQLSNRWHWHLRSRRGAYIMLGGADGYKRRRDLVQALKRLAFGRGIDELYDQIEGL